MRKVEISPILLLISTTLAVVFGALAYIENNSPATGLAALAGVGRFVVYASCFCGAMLISLILGIIVIYKKFKTKSGNTEQER